MKLKTHQQLVLAAIILAGMLTLVVLMRSRTSLPPQDLGELKTMAIESKSVETLLEDLNSKSPQQRRLATYSLGERRSYEARVVKAMSQTLNDKDVLTRKLAIIALGKIGKGAKGTLPKLLSLAENNDKQIQQCLLWSLEKIGGPYEKDIPLVIQELRSAEDFTRQATLDALRKKELAALPHLIAAVENPDPLNLPYVLESIGRLGAGAKPAIPILISQLDERDILVREKSLWALGQMGPSALAAKEKIKSILEDTEESLLIRVLAGNALEKISVENEQSKIDNLRREVTIAVKTENRAQSEAIEAAGSIGVQMAPHLIQLTISENQKIRVLATQTLGQLGPTVTFTLVELLKNSDQELRQAAAMSLGNIDPQPDEGTLALIEALKDPEWEVRQEATLALGKIGSQALPQLREAFLSEDVLIRNGAILAISQMRPEIIPVLGRMLKENNTKIRLALLKVLEKFGPLAESTVPEVGRTLLSDPSQEVQVAAANTLSALGPAAWKGVPHLVKSSYHKSEKVRSAAKKALDEIGTQKAKKALIGS